MSAHSFCLHKHECDCNVAISSNGTPYLLRKEVIHPQLPLRMPCYDLAPIIDPTLGPADAGTSGIIDSLGLTGGVYKTRERIHRAIADTRLLAIPASRGRVAALDPNWG